MENGAQFGSCLVALAVVVVVQRGGLGDGSVLAQRFDNEGMTRRSTLGAQRVVGAELVTFERIEGAFSSVPKKAALSSSRSEAPPSINR